MVLGKQNLIDTSGGSLKEMVKDAAKLLDKYRAREALAELQGRSRQTIPETVSDSDDDGDGEVRGAIGGREG